MIRGEESQHPIKLREHISTHFSHEMILRSKEIRTILLDNLHPKEAIDLLQNMNIQVTNENEVYTKLHSIQFNKNNDAEKLLFRFFEERIPDEYDDSIIADITDIVKPEKKLFDYQRNACDEIMKYLSENKLRCLLHMPTGSGKTTTAMRVITTSFLQSKPTLVIWLAYNEELCEQAIEEFKKTWMHVGDRDIGVTRFFKDYSPDLLEHTKSNKDQFIVASLGKIHQSDKRHSGFLSTLADRVNFVVMDEAHQAIAPSYLNILSQLVEKRPGTTKLLGLTATPGRTSNSEELANFFDHKKATLKIGNNKNPVDYLINEGYLAEPKIRLIRADAKLTSEDLSIIGESSEDIPEDILEKMGRDSRRTLKIIGQVEDLIESKHKRIIVFGTSVNNSRDISMILASLGHKVFHVDGNTSSVTRKQNVDEFKKNSDEVIIMCNFGVFTTGFDAPITSAAVIARPTKSLILYSQMVGRAMRGIRVGGNKKCEIRTITDIRLSGFTQLVDGFFNWEDVWQ